MKKTIKITDKNKDDLVEFWNFDQRIVTKVAGIKITNLTGCEIVQIQGKNAVCDSPTAPARN